MNNLINDRIPGKVLPIAWKLYGAEGIPAGLGSYTDGYQVKSCMKWVPVGEDGGAGTMGACVEALDDAGQQMNSAETGHPVVCQLITVDGNSAQSEPTLTSMSVEQWAAGNAQTFTPNNLGTPVPYSTTKAIRFGLDDLLSEAEDEIEEETVDPSDVEEEEFDLQADDWAESANDVVDAASDAANQAVDDTSKAVKDGAEGVISEVEGQWNTKGPYARYQWWQPAKADSYSGVRRFGKDDKIQAYSVSLQGDNDATFEIAQIGGLRQLTGAQALYASVVVLGAAGLAF